MNTHPYRRKAGFTLVELLVVIVIIAVLAGIGIPMTLRQLEKGKILIAQGNCRSIESAVNTFFTEYGAMPSSASTDTPTATPLDTKTDIDFVKVLLGKETIANPLNFRGLKLLSVSDGKVKGTGGYNGLVYDSSGTTPIGIFDPWGGTYKVVLDGDFDEKITVKPKASDAVSVTLSRRVAVWSNGADGVSATGKAADDVKTW